MSGGVDSSVAAALLVEQGYDVSGLMVHLWAEEENACCSPQAIEDARRVAAGLGIPFELLDYREAFKARVVDYFVAEYSRGRTPNPCLACNRWIRFGRLLDEACRLGARYLATGHYARVERGDANLASQSKAGSARAGGAYRLRMGVDRQKDQSYVLYRLGQQELARVLFPLGVYTKSQVRHMALERGLPVADREESMEICFVADDDYRRFLQEQAPHAIRPGPILDLAGQELGRHRGLPFYTVGQRRGLGIPAAEALYVLRLDVERNALIVGPASQLGRRHLVAEQVSYVSGQPPAAPVAVQAKIRSQATLAEATWTPREAECAEVEFTTPLRDITPGQAVVAYQGDLLLGGGLIAG
jgi:tRNA-uridine 2-sulfurtransferase